MALVLSHDIETGYLYSILISCNVCLIQKSCVQQVAIATYFVFAVDREIQY